MLKRILLLSCILCLSAGILHAQQQHFEIGLSAGYTKNSLTTDSGPLAFTRYHPLQGFQISVPTRYHFLDWFGLQLDLSYIQKNYAIRRSGIFEGVESDFTNSFLQAPLMAHFSFGGESLRGFINLGGYAGYWVSSRIRGANIDIFSPGIDINDHIVLNRITDWKDLYYYNERVQFDEERDRRIELGFLGGIGFEYRLSNHYKVFVETRYHYSLTDLQKNYMVSQIPRYNNTFGIQLGVFYSFGNR